jgi:hypothetical protein
MSILLTNKQNEFRSKFNKTRFLFDHTLHLNPILDLDNIIALAKRAPKYFHASVSNSKADDGWQPARALRLPIAETIQAMETMNAVVVLKDVHLDKEFGRVLEAAQADIIEQAGDQLRSELIYARSTILVNSPHRITAYHIDAECNYLLQVRGQKFVSVFDQDDRTILSDAEIEAFYCGHMGSARYRPEREKDAMVFDLTPGKGVHIPIDAPHWVKNGGSISVSVSTNFELRGNENRRSIHIVNQRLRRLGLKPHAPGVSPASDRLKLAIASGYKAIRRVKNYKHLFG